MCFCVVEVRVVCCFVFDLCACCVCVVVMLLLLCVCFFCACLLFSSRLPFVLFFWGGSFPLLFVVSCVFVVFVFFRFALFSVKLVVRSCFFSLCVC